MDKISSIIPGTSRVTSVDLKDASPVRPGTPAFGRPEHLPVKAAVEAALAPSGSQSKAANAPTQVPSDSQGNDWRSKDAAKAALASKVADNFFSKPSPPPPPTPKEAVPTAAQTDNARSPVVQSNSAQAFAGAKPEEFTALRDVQMRSAEAPPLSAMALLGHDDQEDHIEELPRMRQPEGLYPKGSFLDRTA